MAELQNEQNDIAYEAAVRELNVKIVDNSTFSGPIDDEIKKQYVLYLNQLNKQYQEEYMVDAATFYNVVYGMSTDEFNASVMEDMTLGVKLNLVLDKIAVSEDLDKANPGASLDDLREIAQQFVIDAAEIEGLDG